MVLTQYPDLQYEAAWCITNIASGSQEAVQTLVDKGAIKILVRILMYEGSSKEI